MKRILPLVAVVLIAGCSAEHASSGQSPSTAASPSPTSTAAPAASTVPTATVTVTASATPAPAATPEVSGPCSDDDLSVTNGPLESANTLRHVVVSFTNTSSHPCTLQGYPGADLVTPAGGVLINVPRKPALAAPLLTLNPGDVSNAEVEAYAIDTATGNACPRWGALVVTPPNGFVSHSLSVDVPICGATIGPAT
jgi:Protein of unknown function (DUF4232)